LDISFVGVFYFILRGIPLQTCGYQIGILSLSIITGFSGGGGINSTDCELASTWLNKLGTREITGFYELVAWCNKITRLQLQAHYHDSVQTHPKKSFAITVIKRIVK
jgi:hypothetical protein